MVHVKWLLVALAACCADAAASRPFFDPRSQRTDAIDNDAAFSAAARDPACFASTLVSTGGPAPVYPHTLAVRWTGFSNIELAYGGKVILLDAYFDAGAITCRLASKPRISRKPTSF
jgi:hypothetical protein